MLAKPRNDWKYRGTVQYFTVMYGDHLRQTRHVSYFPSDQGLALVGWNADLRGNTL